MPVVQVALPAHIIGFVDLKERYLTPFNVRLKNGNRVVGGLVIDEKEVVSPMVKIVLDPFFEAMALILEDGPDRQVVLGHVEKKGIPTLDYKSGSTAYYKIKPLLLWRRN